MRTGQGQVNACGRTQGSRTVRHALACLMRHSIVDGPSGPGSRRSRLRPLCMTGRCDRHTGTPTGKGKGEPSSRVGRAKGSGQMSE